MVGRPERQSVAPRVLRTAGVPGSRKRKPPRSITIVASISRVGMIRQHAHGKVSRANNFWERPMHFEKQLSDALSPLLLTGQRDARTISASPGLSLSTTGPAFVGRYRGVRPDVHSFQQIDLRRGESHRTSGGAPIRTRPEQDAPGRVIAAAIFRGGAWVVGALAATGEIVFSRFLLAFMSWTMGEVLAGCAAYAQAMYPCHVEDELVGREGQWQSVRCEARRPAVAIASDRVHRNGPCCGRTRCAIGGAGSYFAGVERVAHVAGRQIVVARARHARQAPGNGGVAIPRRSRFARHRDISLRH